MDVFALLFWACVCGASTGCCFVRWLSWSRAEHRPARVKSSVLINLLAERCGGSEDGYLMEGQT